VGKPAFRVIQTHFAAAGNVGAVAAKEEVWEVTAQLAGFALSVAALTSLEAAVGGGAGDGEWAAPVAAAWAAAQAAHIALRAATLRTLRFPGLSHKRACMLASQHVAGQALDGVAACNAREPLLAAAAEVSPRLRLGVGVAEARAACGGDERALRRRLALHVGEQHALVPAAAFGGLALVLLRPGCGPRGALRAVWQAAWLQAHRGGGGAADDDDALLAASVAALRERFGGFEAEAAAAGWALDGPPMKTEAARVSWR